jgi:hypothetical protein
LLYLLFTLPIGAHVGLETFVHQRKKTTPPATSAEPARESPASPAPPAASTTAKVRLEGIDAPERGQPIGRKAKEVLSKLLSRKTVAVRSIGIDTYDRTLGRVFVGVDKDVVNAKARGMCGSGAQPNGAIRTANRQKSPWMGRHCGANEAAPNLTTRMTFWGVAASGIALSTSSGTSTTVFVSPSNSHQFCVFGVLSPVF